MDKSLYASLGQIMSTCSPMTSEITWGTLGVPWVPGTTSSIEPMACKAEWQPGANTATAAALTVTVSHLIYLFRFAATCREQLWLTIGHDQKCWLSLDVWRILLLLRSQWTIWQKRFVRPTTLVKRLSGISKKEEMFRLGYHTGETHSYPKAYKWNEHHEHPSNPSISLSTSTHVPES